MSGPRRHPALLDRNTAVLLVIDVQEAYRAALHEYERVAGAIATLVQGAVTLGIPMIATEQYPKGLGHTVPEVSAHFPAGHAPIEKRSLSCCGAPAFVSALRVLGRRQIIIAGIETHACVNQTAHDLIADGYQVHLVRDATGSRRPLDSATGWDKVVGAGAIPATVESVLLELLQTAEAPEFKAIQRLIR